MHAEKKNKRQTKSRHAAGKHTVSHVEQPEADGPARRSPAGDCCTISVRMRAYAFLEEPVRHGCGLHTGHGRHGRKPMIRFLDELE